MNETQPTAITYGHQTDEVFCPRMFTLKITGEFAWVQRSNRHVDTPDPPNPPPPPPPTRGVPPLRLVLWWHLEYDGQTQVLRLEFAKAMDPPLAWAVRISFSGLNEKSPLNTKNI